MFIVRPVCDSRGAKDEDVLGALKFLMSALETRIDNDAICIFPGCSGTYPLINGQLRYLCVPIFSHVCAGDIFFMPSTPLTTHIF